jgi:outer membrane protein assembly factor BamB
MTAWTAAALALAQVAAGSPDRGDALLDAARRGDAAAVRALLDAGVPVDAANRHGTTALILAASRGALDVVRLLVERGADVDAHDRFFGSSPVGSALQGKHLDVARFLVEKGAADVDEALAAAVKEGDVDLARAALGTAKVEPLELAAARRLAPDKQGREMKELLAEAAASRRRRPAYEARPERLAAYAAVRYRAQRQPADAPADATVARKGDGLLLAVAGQPDLVLRPVREDVFETAGGDAAVAFGGRGGLIEWMRVNRGGDVVSFAAVTSSPTDLPVAAGAAEGAARAPRRPAIDWPSFRGPAGSGVGDGQGVPLTWDVGSGKNVRFRTELPGMGNSSPIVWKDRIFVTTAVSATGERSLKTGLYGEGSAVDDLSVHSFRLVALDKASGRVLWDREVHRGSPGARRHLKSSQANSTPATDGRRVVVLFGTVGVLAAYDLDGRPLWKRDVGVMDCGDEVFGNTEWGHASSPLIRGETVILQADRKKDSFLAAYRLEDGAEVYRVPREEGSTWASPALVRGPAGDELVTNGRTIRGYDPADGKLLWTLGPNSEVVVATPVAGAGVAFVTGGYPPVRPVFAIRAGHRGDLSLPEGRAASDAVVWSKSRGGTYIPTPILYGEHLYTLNNNGILTCYRADTGEQVYESRVGTGGSFAASPVAADERLFVTSETGEVYVLRAGPRYELVSRNDMAEPVMATPAISDGLLVVRTLSHVVGIAETQGDEERGKP